PRGRPRWARGGWETMARSAGPARSPARSRRSTSRRSTARCRNTKSGWNMPANEVPSRVEIYDTTLRDGAQLEGISLTVDDKLRIAEQLDWLGVHYIEAGWPGSNPKDDEAFRRIPHELKLQTSRAVPFC